MKCSEVTGPNRCECETRRWNNVHVSRVSETYRLFMGERSPRETVLRLSLRYVSGDRRFLPIADAYMWFCYFNAWQECSILPILGKKRPKRSWHILRRCRGSSVKPRYVLV